jgi:hypothetical protein
MANRERGEISVTLGGKSYPLRPTFEAQCEAEDICGRGIVEMANRFQESKYGIREVAALIFTSMRAAGETGATFEAVGRLVAAEGIAAVKDAYLALLAEAVSGGKKPKPGEDGAAAGS